MSVKSMKSTQMNTDVAAKITTAVIAFAALVALVALIPFAVIWGWNQLFGAMHTIEFTFWNWLAVIALGLFFNTRVSKSK